MYVKNAVHIKEGSNRDKLFKNLQLLYLFDGKDSL